MNALRRKYAGMMGGLPYDSRVEYLESNGTQYIDTDMLLNIDDKIVADITRRTLNNNDNFYFGQRIVNNSLGGTFVSYTGSQYFYVRFASTSSASALYRSNVNTRFTIELQSGDFKINGTTVLSPVNNGTLNDTPITIFGRLLADGSNVSVSNVRFHQFTIYDSNDIARINLLPVRIGQVGYMYDTVSGKLFGNSGTNDFIVGPDVIV